MKIRVIYNDQNIISVDKPEGAAALDYDHYNLAIADHSELLPRFTDAGFDVSKISMLLLENRVEIENPAWYPRVEESASNRNI